MDNWVKAGTHIRCRNGWSIPHPVEEGPFEVKEGTEASILRIGPGEVKGVDGRWYFVGDDAMPGDIIIGWFEFVPGQNNGFLVQMRGDFEHNWEPIGNIAAARPRPKIGMLLQRHPDKPGEKTDHKFLGFWASSTDPEADRYAQRDILLPWPADFVDPAWDPAERARVVQYLKAAPPVEFWRGYSHCRLGCERLDGTRDLGDGTFVWPEGFAHYVEVHGIRPPEEFLEHVRRCT